MGSLYTKNAAAVFKDEEEMSLGLQVNGGQAVRFRKHVYKVCWYAKYLQRNE